MKTKMVSGMAIILLVVIIGTIIVICRNTSTDTKLKMQILEQLVPLVEKEIKARYEVSDNEMVKVEKDKEAILIKFREQSFLIHTFSEEHGFSVNTVEVTGPSDKGLIVRLEWRSMLPSDFQEMPIFKKEPYWSRQS